MQRKRKQWSVNGEPTPAQIGEVASILRSGGIALLPTDTIYGLHAAAENEQAVSRLTAIKGREQTKPFVVIGSSIEQLESIGVSFGEEAHRVASSLWPAPLTVISRLAVPVAASRGEESLAVRVPDLAWLRHLLALTGPLASTSANRASEPAILEPAELARDVLDSVDAVLDAGRLEGKPSTIVDFTDRDPRVIREGDSAFAQKVWKTLRKSL